MPSPDHATSDMNATTMSSISLVQFLPPLFYHSKTLVAAVSGLAMQAVVGRA